MDNKLARKYAIDIIISNVALTGFDTREIPTTISRLESCTNAELYEFLLLSKRSLKDYYDKIVYEDRN